MMSCYVKIVHELYKDVKCANFYTKETFSQQGFKMLKNVLCGPIIYNSLPVKLAGRGPNWCNPVGVMTIITISSH